MGIIVQEQQQGLVKRNWQYKVVWEGVICRRAAPQVMPPILLYWSTTSEADAGGMVVEPSHQCSPQRQSDKMASDIEVQVKQKYVIEFLHVEKTAPIDIHQNGLQMEILSS